ncbi:uncharacterized protein LOC126840408 [Adelges cooleyi]|uniref:uncharacterized protein LOC126840408 n=1 Tax=Adelges cooleyi TaxID=133065 RepID=UPI00217FF3B5|nr:uncharacterized protein LOC126840408 [Adelges cooleyi]
MENKTEENIIKNNKNTESDEKKQKLYLSDKFIDSQKNNLNIKNIPEINASTFISNNENATVAISKSSSTPILSVDNNIENLTCISTMYSNSVLDDNASKINLNSNKVTPCNTISSNSVLKKNAKSEIESKINVIVKSKETSNQTSLANLHSENNFNSNNVTPCNTISSNSVLIENNAKSEIESKMNFIEKFEETSNQTAFTLHSENNLNSNDVTPCITISANSLLIEKNVKSEIDIRVIEKSEEISNPAALTCLNSPSLENIDKKQKELQITNFKQFSNCGDNKNVRCTLCHCIIRLEKSLLDQHVTSCNKQQIQSSYGINAFFCLICETNFKSPSNWKTHIITPAHIEKCKNGKYIFSYNCGGCKAMFYGPKDQILEHCQTVHNDKSSLPCIFKLISLIFFQYININPGNSKLWKFCGPCKTFSDNKLNCLPYKHRNKRTKVFECKSCLIEFQCSQEVYDKHLLSGEHIVLQHLRTTTTSKSTPHSICNLKLPKLILNKFSVDSYKAICNACKSNISLDEKSLVIHLSKCMLKQDTTDQNLTKINQFYCAVCHEDISDFIKWTNHLITPNHILKCQTFNNLVSYTCDSCAKHCFGSEHFVTEHQKLHPNTHEVKFSNFKAHNFQRIGDNLNCKELYYCELCATHAQVTSGSDHMSKSHKTRLHRVTCDTCRIHLLCVEGNKLYNQHLLSSEHIMLKYLASAKLSEPKISSLLSSNLNTSIDSKKSTEYKYLEMMIKTKIPLFFKSFLNWFSYIEDQNKAKCLVCNILINIDDNDLISHVLFCNKTFAEKFDKTMTKKYVCFNCSYNCNVYDEWKSHAISHGNKDNTGLNSIFCKHCCSLLYGKERQIFQHLKNEHNLDLGKMPLESTFISELFSKRTDIKNENFDVLYFCEPCKKYFKVEKNQVHFNANSHISVALDSTELFYCTSCKIEFSCSVAMFHTHKLTVEHIVLSLSHESNETEENIPKHTALDFHLLTYVINQKLYEETLNIGFFCFLCNYLCNTLGQWKIHICSKNHINHSKGPNLDHRCKICKTLMFGQRTQIFEHYKNQFHSKLRQYKLSFNKTDISSKQSNNEVATSNKTKEISTNEQNTLLLISKMMNELSIQSNTSNFSIYFKMRSKMMYEMSNKKNINKTQIVYFCALCDFITGEEIQWDNHKKSEHSNTVSNIHNVLCDVCRLYIFGPDNNLEHHVITIEHKLMVEFQKLESNKMETTRTAVKLVNNKSINDTKNKEEKQQFNTKKEENEDTRNRRIYIEIKGAKPEHKKNNWVDLKKVFQPFGYFGIFSNNNTIKIFFRRLSSISRVLEEKENLEKKHQFTINVLDDEELMPDLNKLTEYEFGNKIVIMKLIEAQLDEITYEITNPSIPNKLILLINSIHRCAGPTFLYGKTYAFGSRMSGLALRDSDVDLYFDIGNTFTGLLSNDPATQEDLVRYFGKVFRSQTKEFRHIQTICAARVPIVKFLHVPSGLHCDLSFKSGLSTHNTKLVRLYLMLDKRVHWVVCAVVKRWALQNNLKNQGMFTSYALAWLVLFYLMTINVVPPLKYLRDYATVSDIMFIEDWDCTFCTPEMAKQIWKVPEIPPWELLNGFFSYYSNPITLKKLVLCPAIGETIPKDMFFNIPMNAKDILGFHKKKTGDPTQRCNEIRGNFFGEGLAVQDPFDLFHNITKTISLKKLNIFCHLCSKTKEIMSNGVQFYYA